MYGHAVGDAMLVAVAQRLSALDLANVGVARLGGDELLLFARWRRRREAVAADRGHGAGGDAQNRCRPNHTGFTQRQYRHRGAPDGGKTADECGMLTLPYQARMPGATRCWFGREAATRLRERTVLGVSSSAR